MLMERNEIDHCVVANQLHFEVQFICFMKEFETVKVSNWYDHRV